MMGSEDHSTEVSESCIWMDPLGDKKRKMRFSDDQIRSLEFMFETQTKLDPRKKQQLAGELGLQPRQVAIWFQNKRARWKSKQLEREYGALRADYDALLSSFESLKKEKQVLTKQVQMLTELLEEPLEEPRKHDDSNNGDKEDPRPSLPVAEKSDLRVTMHSDDNEKMFSNFSEEEAELYMGQTAAGFSTSSEQQFCFQPCWPLEQSCNSSQWWEFWTMNE